MTDAFNDSLETLSYILSIAHNLVLSDEKKVERIEREVESFLERHEEGNARPDTGSNV